MGPLGSGLRVGADRVGYQESSNTPGFVRAKRTFLASNDLTLMIYLKKYISPQKLFPLTLFPSSSRSVP